MRQKTKTMLSAISMFIVMLIFTISCGMIGGTLADKIDHNKQKFYPYTQEFKAISAVATPDGVYVTVLIPDPHFYKPKPIKAPHR
jgi:hypothetical protein